MFSPSNKPVIFISYSHKDEPERPGPDDVPWLSFVLRYLQPAVKHGVFDLSAAKTKIQLAKKLVRSEKVKPKGSDK